MECVWDARAHKECNTTQRNWVDDIRFAVMEQSNYVQATTGQRHIGTNSVSEWWTTFTRGTLENAKNAKTVMATLINEPTQNPHVSWLAMADPGISRSNN